MCKIWFLQKPNARLLVHEDLFPVLSRRHSQSIVSFWRRLKKQNICKLLFIACQNLCNNVYECSSQYLRWKKKKKGKGKGLYLYIKPRNHWEGTKEILQYHQFPRGPRNFGCNIIAVGRDSSVGIVISWTVRGLNPSSGEFSAPVKVGPSAHPGSRTEYRVIPARKAARRGVNHTIQSSAEVKENVKLYLYSPFVPSWQVIGWSLSLHSTLQHVEGKLRIILFQINSTYTYLARSTYSTVFTTKSIPSSRMRESPTPSVMLPTHKPLTCYNCPQQGALCHARILSELNTVVRWG
jgi:hypothetical protein